MTFSLNDDLERGTGLVDIGIESLYSAASPDQQPDRTGHNEIHLVHDKLQIPETDDAVERPRLIELLERSRSRFPATLISGRTGTGKTSIAASFAKTMPCTAWYSVESSDTDWEIFTRYFTVFADPDSLLRQNARSTASGSKKRRGPHTDEIARFLLEAFSRRKDTSPELLVMDDVHHLFDVAWFEDFFNLLIHSLPDRHHLLLLCRSKPASPLWRLRSKQMLNVIDEKVIAMDTVETQLLLERYGIEPSDAAQACSDSYGRVGKLRENAQRLKSESK